jgi:hypothetical protein
VHALKVVPRASSIEPPAVGMAGCARRALMGPACQLQLRSTTPPRKGDEVAPGEVGPRASGGGASGAETAGFLAGIDELAHMSG